MSQDLSNYDASYYERDQTFARHRVLRSDQLAALCYALDWPFWGMDDPAGGREPGLILSMGCGRGELELQFERMGHDVIGVDPTVGARHHYSGSMLVLEAAREDVQRARTIIFCESIEHIPSETTSRVLEAITPGARLIIVNFVDFHPIIPGAGDGWDHITQVDDDLYDSISERHIVILRRGAHLVVDW